MSDVLLTLERGYTLTWRGRGNSGVPTEMRCFQLWTFRGDQALRMALYRDEDEARRAAALGP
jgi:hypothetical protein